MNEMEEMFKQFIEAIKTNRKALNQFKNSLIVAGQYELASKIRELENDAFPESKETKDAIKMGNELKTALSMVEIITDAETCWVITKTIESYNQKKGEFSLEDSVNIRLKAEAIFPNYKK